MVPQTNHTLSGPYNFITKGYKNTIHVQQRYQLYYMDKTAIYMGNVGKEPQYILYVTGSGKRDIFAHMINL